MSEKIDYNKTVELKKLILQDRKFPSFHLRLLFIVLVSLGGIFTYLLIKAQLQVEKIATTDYFIVIFAAFIYILLIVIAYKTFFNRNRLKEIKITLHRDEAREKILKAASELNWSLFMTSNSYLRFYTKSSLINDRQSITIIFFPDNRVYFNSLHYPDDDSRPSRFDQNYSSLTEKIK